MNKITLRPYQTRAKKLLTEAAIDGVRRILLVSPTGSGKGSLAGEIVDTTVERGRRVLFVVAGRQLVDEFSVRLEDQFGRDHGVVMAGHHRGKPHLPVQVASIDTLASHVRKGIALPPADLIVVDECDLVAAPRFLDVLAHYPDAFCIGTTATPVRADGQGLGLYFQRIVVAATPKELIREGFLVDWDGLGFRSLDTSKMKRGKGGDFTKASFDIGTSRTEKLNGDIVAKWFQHARGRRTVGFAMHRAHSRQIVERFNAERHHGGPIARAEHIDGDMATGVRKGIIGRLFSGETQVVSNVGILTRGVDIPPLEVCAWWRPTASRALYLQMAGRVFRTMPCVNGHPFRPLAIAPECPICGGAWLKREAFFLDHVGNMDSHGDPDKDQSWTLADGLVKDSDDELESMTECIGCRAMFPVSRRKCPDCGRSVAMGSEPREQAEIKEVLNVETFRLRDRAQLAPAIAPAAPAAKAGPPPIERATLKAIVRHVVGEKSNLRRAGHIYANGGKRLMPSDALLRELADEIAHENRQIQRQILAAVGGRR